MVVALMAVVLSVTGSAVAAKLITGRQIKNGTITKADLSKALQAQLRTAAQPGATGPKGDAGGPGPKGDVGVPGPGAVKVDTDIVSPSNATVTAATLGALRVVLTGCANSSGAAAVHLVSTTAATIAISWSFDDLQQSPFFQAIGPGNDYDFPLLLSTGSRQMMHGVYRDAVGNVSTLELVVGVTNAGGTARTCRVSGALVPTS
jgi:hypothetical protein